MPAVYDELKKELDKVMTSRAPWENRWQELRELIHPEGSDFNRKAAKGEIRSEQIYEGTAPWACELFASGLGSFFTPKTRRFAHFGIANYDFLRDRSALEWAEEVTNIVFHQYAMPQVNFYDSHHEVYLDLGALGTAVICQEWDWKRGHLIFKAIPLGDCWILENDMGIVDTLFRRVSWTTQQIKDHFSKPGDMIPKKIADEKDSHKVWEIYHVVKPRHHRNVRRFNPQNKKFASVWFTVQGDGLLRDSGMDNFPYFTPRWFKKSGEVYGRGPGHTCLPDIRMINAMEKTQIRSAQKQADPPLLVPSDGFVMPIRTSPSSLIFFEPGLANNEMLKPLETRGRYDIGEDKMGQKREHILRCFYADWFQRQKKRERQTATEIMDDREEMLNLMGPNLARLEVELLSAEMFQSYILLDEAGRIPPAPPQIQGAQLSITFISPAVQAQNSGESLRDRRWLTEEVVPLMQIDPSLADVIDFEEYLRESSIKNNVSRKIIKSKEAVEATRQARAQQEQMAQMATTLQPAAAAMKDIATAKEKGLNLPSL